MLFYKDADFKVFPTTYLAMKYSDDEGETWSDLQIVSTFKPEESKISRIGTRCRQTDSKWRTCRKIDCSIVFGNHLQNWDLCIVMTMEITGHT